MFDKEVHTALAKSLYNRTWELMGLTERSKQQDDEMLSTAHASAYHWLQVGSDKNFSISQWQLSRVYALLGRPESAIYHAQRAIDYAASGSLRPFYHAYGYEALTRAYTVAGNSDKAGESLARAEDYLPLIEDPEEAKALIADLATAIKTPA